MSIKISGLNAVLENIKDINAAKIVAEIVAETAITVDADAKQLSPVDTGRMRASIRIVTEKPTLAHVTVNVEYAKFVELGTYKQRAQPFLRTALEKNRVAFYQKIKSRLK